MRALATRTFGDYDKVLNLYGNIDDDDDKKEQEEGGGDGDGVATTPPPLPPVPRPMVGPTDVLIEVHYSDVNPVDIQKISRNKGTPVRDDGINNGYFISGYSGSGIVIEIGTNVPQQKQENPNNNGNDDDDDDCEYSPGTFVVGITKVAFISDPNRSGTYAQYCSVDYRCCAIIPSTTSSTTLSLRDAATIPLAGLTAYESLVKLNLGPPPPFSETTTTISNSTTTTTTKMKKKKKKKKKKTLLVVGGSGGVGSWAILLARAFYNTTELDIIATASTDESKTWCNERLNVTMTIGHDEISTKLEGGRIGSVDAVLCLSEPKKDLFIAISDVIKSYGTICFVVSGTSISNIDLSFCFFKCVNIVTQTVFSSIRTKYDYIIPGQEIQNIIQLLVPSILQQTKKSINDDKGGGCEGNNNVNVISAVPLSPLLLNGTINDDWNMATKPNGVLSAISTGHIQGKLVMRIK